MGYISIDEAMFKAPGTKEIIKINNLKPYKVFRESCRKLYEEFSNVFKPELDCFSDIKLEVKFKPNATPVCYKPRPMQFAQNDLTQFYDIWIAKGIWKPTQFCPYGTPVVSFRKALLYKSM